MSRTGIKTWSSVRRFVINTLSYLFLSPDKVFEVLYTDSVTIVVLVHSSLWSFVPFPSRPLSFPREPVVVYPPHRKEELEYRYTFKY